MKLKDLFNSTKTIQSSSLEDMANEVESQEYIESFNKDKIRFMPNVDYSDPKNFAFFGSAERYYTDGFKRIRNTFPYDGSEKEKYDWLFDSTFIDMYLFEHKYPRFNGYATLSYPNWGTLNGSIIDGYGKSTTNTYIKTFGGPNKSDLLGLKKQYEDANILDADKSRESNLKFDLSEGVTIEMWVKKPAFDTSKTEKEVLFDLWNGEASSSAQYGRLRLELTGASSGSPFLFTALSGTSGIQNQSIGQDLTTGSIEDWTHVALSLKNSGNDISANLYINGQFNQEQTVSSAAIENVTGSIISYIGALQTAPSGSPTVTEGAGKFSGSIDEFRYWKTERTSKEIGRYYWTNIGGGTNSDEANTNLGVYYKFNEGITQTSSIDSRVLDYSGRVSNGSWFGYQDGARSEDSAIVLAGVAPKEFKDPTIYSAHPDYISTLSELQSSGSNHDINNNASLIKSVPGWILEEDKEEGNVNILTHIMASYYDNLYLHIQDLNSLKDVYAHFQTKITDRHNNTDTEGSVKPLPFADRLLTNAGFVAPELFADASVIEALATRSEDEHYEMKLHDVKNQIYQNVYSSLVNIYKEKGTNKAFRNVLHAFGIDEDVVKINFYGDNVDFEINDRYNIRASKEKFVDFNHPDRFAGTIYQYASGTDGVSFISGSGGDFEKYIPVTVETQVILPNKLEWTSAEGFQTPFTKSVILGMHEADPSDGTDYTIPLSDYSEIQMYTVRDREESRRVRFHLSSSVLGVHLSSSLYDDMYLNNEWLLSFRIRNEKFPTTDFVASSSLNADYIIDFVGFNTDGNSTINSFEFSSSVAAADAHNFLNSSKRLYAGAKRTNFTGSLQERSDHKIGFVRYWMNYLDNETLKQHSYDSNNVGAKSPMRSAYLMEDSINDIKVPEIDTLLLNWDFKTLSKSDANGQFISIDVTSGSGEQRYVQAFEDVKRKFYHGRGDKFLANDEKVIDVEYINAARSTYPEILQGDDMIEIRTQDDIQFTKETLPQDYYIAFEKSMAQTVSEEMIRFMSSVKDFNNLIGRPVDKYRQEYKDLTNLRQLFFERVSNEPDLDKYIDYYKWLDDSLGEMLVALVPASLAHSDGVNNVIENYVFSRDKYDHKFPTIEFKAPTPEGGMNTINRHLYPWKQGHAPTSGNEDENCYWHLERKEKDEPRTKIFQARNSVLNRSFTTAQHFAVDRTKAIHGGTNYEDNKKRDYIWSATKEVAESPLTYGEYGGFPLRYVLTNNDMFQSLKDCSDERPVTEKIKRAFSAVDGFTAFHHHQSGGIDGVYKGGMVFPFNIMSSSVTTGYTSQVNGIPGLLENVDVVNIHSDTTDNTNEIPMQSPFTERWVGGHQHRHAPINDGNDSMQTRGEGYKILINNIENQSGSIGIVGADYPHPYASQYDAPFFNVEQAKARYYREERAKRPVNIKNIETTGSQVGNYQKKYQFVHTFGRTQNKTFFRGVGLDENIHNQINSSMPATNLETSLVARGTTGEGNLASNFDSSNLYLGGIKDSNPPTSGSTPSKHTIASKFSAPGGFETMSEVFLDLSAKEHSAYNALPFRNLQVRGSGSGEEGSILHLEDIHGNRYGLMSHLTRHSSWGGVDSVVGNNKPSFHKVNRNPKWDASEEEKDYDNYWVQHQIPQSDFQYQWVKQSHTASYATSSLAGHVLSGFTEPSGTTSRYPHEHIDNTVVSQSVINQRIDGVTAYGYPSWDQIRNNDKNVNIQLKKAYGYNVNSGNVEESRVTENIPNSADVKFRDSEFQFKYPYVNMKYHFDNRKLRFETDKTKNETLYKSIYGYYSQNTDDVEILKKNIKQIIFPRYVKHTKYSTRHRHFFASKFWAKGENDLYNSDISETGSYYRLDEQGRRETNVTASLFAEGSLNSQIKEMMDLGHLTNIIPSQSIWDMDSRTNFTSSDPQAAASDSDGAPGVLQNQDHHFHNGLKTLLVTGSAATGSFRTKGATVFGTPSSGSFRVQGMVPTGIKATGSFEVTGATVFGTETTWGFTMEEPYVPGVSSSMTFRAGEATTLGTTGVASFQMSGAYYAGSVTTGQFTLDNAYVGGTAPTAGFTVDYRQRAEQRTTKLIKLKPLKSAANPNSTNATNTLSQNYLNTSPNYDDAYIRFGSNPYTPLFNIVTKADDHYNSTPTDTTTNKYISIFADAKYPILHRSDSQRVNTATGAINFDSSSITIAFWIALNTSANSAYNDFGGVDGAHIFLRLLDSNSNTVFSLHAQRNTIGSNVNYGMYARVYHDNAAYRQGSVLNMFSSGWNHVVMKYSVSSATFEIYLNGSSQGFTLTTSGTPSSALRTGSRLFLGDSGGNFTTKVDELAIYDTSDSNYMPDVSYLYNSGRYSNILNYSASNLVHYWRLGDGDDDGNVTLGDLNLIDYVGTANFNTASNTNSNISFSDQAIDFRKSALKTEKQFAEEFVDMLYAELASEYTIRLNCGLKDGYTYPEYSISLIQTSTGSDPTINVSSMSQYKSPLLTHTGNSRYDESNMTSGFSFGDTITIDGNQFDIGHHSPGEIGDFNTYDASDSTRTKSLRFGQTTVSDIRATVSPLYGFGVAGTNPYYCYGKNAVTGLTVSVWIRPDDADSSTVRYFLIGRTTNTSQSSDGRKPFPNSAPSGEPGGANVTVTSYDSWSLAWQNGNLIIRMYSSQFTSSLYTVGNAFKDGKWYHVYVELAGNGTISQTPVVYINGVSKGVSVNSAGSGTPIAATTSLFIGGSSEEMQGHITELALFNGTSLPSEGTTTAAALLYNKGRRSPHILSTVPKLADRLNNYWKLGDEFTSISLPATPSATDGTFLTATDTTISGDNHAKFQADITLPKPTYIKIVEGVLKERTNGLDGTDFFNNIKTSLESNSVISTAAFTDNTTSANFTVTHAAAGSTVRYISEIGTTFSNTSNFTNGTDSTGIATGAKATFLVIRKGSYDYSVNYGTGTTENVVFDFKTSGGSTVTTNSYTTNPVLIDVTQFASNTALWDKVLQAIDNHGSLLIGSVTRTNGTFSLTTTDKADGNTYFIQENDAGGHISNISNAGGDPTSGSSTSHSITIDGAIIDLTTNNNASDHVDVVGVTNSQVWDRMKVVIDSSHVDGWEVASTQSVNSRVMQFNLQATQTGSVSAGTVTSVGSTFNVTDDGSGGSDETGATAGDYIELFNGNPEEDLRKIQIITAGSTTDGDPDQNGDATSYINSVGTNTAFWDSIQDRLEYWGYGVQYNNYSTYATFTVQSYLEGTAGDQPLPNNNTYGSTFSNVTDFNGGSDDSGATPGSTLSFKKDANTTKTVLLVDTAPNAAYKIRCDSASVNKTGMWNAIYNYLNDTAGTNHTVVQGNDSPRTFSMTYYQTGAFDPTPAVTGDAFVLTSTTVGTDETGARAGDTITIDNQVFTIVHSLNPNPREINASGVSNTEFLNALKNEIINSSSFATASYGYSGVTSLFQKFNLTASTTGTVYNISFDTSSANQRTFDVLDGAAGGTDTFGLQHIDRILIQDSDGNYPNAQFSSVHFQINTASSTPETEINDYTFQIGIQDIKDPSVSQTDAERSQAAWNRISASIKSRSQFSNITIEEFIDTNGGADGEHHAIFHITSSNTGSVYNDDILLVATSSDDGRDGFTISSNTSGGTDESGAKAGDTITIDGVTFTLVTGSAAGAGEVLCGTNVNNLNTLSNDDYFNNLTAAIEASTSLDPVSWTVFNSDSASFSLTSSVTGTVDNSPMTETGNTFYNLAGMSGGYDPVYIKFGDIIPTPRYGYPHVLTSPGSLRAPSAKSNLGLIDNDYKLRSNHFSLTRSLGYTTDGLYDNTSRWTTPDLSGLTPMDDDYNVWYERVRGHNKHFSLIPEFRMSSHVEGIIKNGMDEKSYFAKNYWLEITGASLDDGQTVARNNRGESAEFLKEYSSTTNIRDIEDFIEDNVANMDLQPFTLTLTCEALKSFLPYDGFYPQSRTVQMCEAFAGSYGKGITAVEANPDDTELEFPDNNAIAQTRPVFDAVMSPGLLYNTIKSGMAVDYPVVTTKMATASLKDPYGGTNHMISNEFFDNRLPFETLLKPESHMSKEYIVDMNPHPSSSVNLKAKIGEASDPNYKLMSNNFFAEAMEFFLQEGKSSRIVSKPENDPDFGIVIANHAGILPTYRSIFRVYKSKKQHPWVEFEGVSEVIKDKTEDGYYYVNESKKDRFYNRPPSGTNYFLSEYQGLTGTDLEYDIEKINYPRPQMNTYAEVETITMYSQPNAFGPPCAGGVAVEYKGRNGDGDAITGGRNNTTYMMYDSTNGYNAPFTPPYYDGEAWAIYTFTPQKSGKHTLNEILQNTTVEYLRYELNHESGSYGDRGTFGPQGYTINDNAMQVDASFNLFKQVANGEEGSSWVIESKFETPILDFSKYLNREYNAEFESEVTSDDIYTDKLSLSGSRQEPDTLSAVHSSLSTVHELSGILNPIGMWHQYGEFPQEADRGIFMQMIDMPVEYQQLGTELPIANPKYAVVKPNIASCDGAGLDAAYNDNPRDTMFPYFKKQIIKRRLVGDDEFAVEGGSIQIINPETDVIIDTELRYVDLQKIFGINLTSTASAAENFKMFDVFRDTTSGTMATLTGSDFTTPTLDVYVDGVQSNDYDASTNGNFAGHWAASYYHYDRESSYAPLLITTKNYDSMAYDYGEFSKGFFEDFLADFSIGIPYGEQSTRYGDALEVGCHSGANGTVLVPGYISQIIDKNNNELTIGKLANINMTDASRASLTDLVGARTIAAVATPATMNATAISINNSIRATRVNSNTFSAVRKTNRRFKFGLIPDYPAVSALASADTSSYKFPEPMFVRGAIKYNAGAPTASSDVNQRKITYFKKMPQYAPQSDNNIGGNPSTVRWGQFMHSNSDPVKSLAELVGFDKEPVKMGVTAKSRVIKEAVVAVPYITNKDKIPEFLNLNLENGTSQDPEVQRQIQKMKEYVFPPHLDFLNYDVQPVPMYIFEFTKTLERDDLNGLWQGVITEDLKRVEEDSKTITHVLSPNSLLGSLKDVSPNMNILKKVRWRIFKVKQRGNFSYEEKMNKDLGKATKDKDLVGYNWPYDYFSLVENVKLSVDVELKKPTQALGGTALIPEGGYTGTGIGGDPIATDAFDLEIGREVSINRSDFPENLGQSVYSSQTQSQEDQFTYGDAKNEILREFRKAIRTDLRSRNKKWNDLKIRAKRRYVKRAINSVELTVVYANMVDSFPNIKGFTERLKPRDF